MFEGDDALDVAAAAVRRELIRLDLVSGGTLAGGEDKAIAAAVIRAWFIATTQRVRAPEEYAATPVLDE